MENQEKRKTGTILIVLLVLIMLTIGTVSTLFYLDRPSGNSGLNGALMAFSTFVPMSILVFTLVYREKN
ncbi:hypothetical protein [Lishizhenia sp.]|uniref:hypothetical protein n=1 Tax=Lishizhenia sp. TaxID=2497594 RepID=UPI00299F2F47|nr:hypothetical protein [Lishizhenia sp.]MDX1445623.1 hypothetical protein [Lishizhenia sp.]